MLTFNSSVTRLDRRPRESLFEKEERRKEERGENREIYFLVIYPKRKRFPGINRVSGALINEIKEILSRERERFFNATVLPFSEGRILELHSPDGVHECWLRAADNAEANVWFNALHSALAALTLKALRLASALPDPPQLQHIGWLARRHCLQVSDLARFVACVPRKSRV